MSLAARAREAVRESPHLLYALRAGVLNYTAAARRLGVGEDEEAIATALRRFEATLPPLETRERDARVTVHRGIERIQAPNQDAEEPIIVVGGAAYATGDGDLTAVLAHGAVDPGALAHVLERCHAADVPVETAGVADDALVLVVPARDGSDALRQVEAGLATVPD